MRFVQRLLITVGIVVVLTAITAAAPVYGGSLSIAPLRQEITLAPGQAFTSKLKIANNSQAPATITLSAQSFNVVGENYDYDFASSEGTADWVHFDISKQTLPPGGSLIVNYTVGVPATAEPGERYIAIFASTSDKPVQNVTAVDRVGLLLYMAVGGNVTHKGQVFSLSLPSVTTKSTVPWRLKLNNTGSAHFHSRITTWVAGVVGKTINATSTDHLSLPSTVRLYKGEAKTGSWPGLYRIRFKVGQGDDSAFDTTRWVLYAPIWSLIMLVVLIVVGIKLVPTIRKRLKAKPVPQTVPKTSAKPKVPAKKPPQPKAKAKPKKS